MLKCDTPHGMKILGSWLNAMIMAMAFIDLPGSTLTPWCLGENHGIPQRIGPQFNEENDVLVGGSNP